VPPYQAAESAAAVMVFADAFERAGTLDKETVRDAIAETDIQTFFGGIKFDETGKNIAKPMALYQVLDGAFKIVAPTAFAETAAVIPRPAIN
jgi:branched-chain amino acid transport system substrate-binding protein